MGKVSNDLQPNMIQTGKIIDHSDVLRYNGLLYSDQTQLSKRGG